MVGECNTCSFYSLLIQNANFDWLRGMHSVTSDDCKFSIILDSVTPYATFF